MIISEEELQSLYWWCSWANEETVNRVQYTKQMEKEGEIDSGAYQKELEYLETVHNFFKKYGKPLE